MTDSSTVEDCATFRLPSAIKPSTCGITTALEEQGLQIWDEDDNDDDDSTEAKDFFARHLTPDLCRVRGSDRPGGGTCLLSSNSTVLIGLYRTVG